MALRPRPSASTISSRYGSHALARGRAAGRRPRRAESVDTSRDGRFCRPGVGGHLRRMAGFGGRGRRPPAAAAHRRSRRPSDRRWPSRGGRRSPPRCAAATSPAAPAPGLAAVCRRSRRCSCRRRTISSPPASTSRRATVMAGFQVSINGRFWVSTEGHGGSLLAGLRPGLVTTRLPRAVRSRRSQISTVSGTSPQFRMELYKERAQGAMLLGLGYIPGSDLLSHAPAHAVPSAVADLTSVFGMGTGVTLLL